jgi:winged helix-turn-helix protein
MEDQTMVTEDRTSSFDSARAEAFAGQVLTVLSHGALCLMVSVGHRTGLFDVMIRLPPSTSDAEQAHAADRQQRRFRPLTGRTFGRFRST